MIPTHHSVGFFALKSSVQFAAYITAGKGFSPIFTDLAPSWGPVVGGSVCASLGVGVADCIMTRAYSRCNESEGIDFYFAKWLVKWLVGSAILGRVTLPNDLTIHNYWRVAGPCFVSLAVFECLNLCIESCQETSRIMAVRRFLSSLSEAARASDENFVSEKDNSGDSRQTISSLPLSEREIFVHSDNASSFDEVGIRFSENQGYENQEIHWV